MILRKIGLYDLRIKFVSFAMAASVFTLPTIAAAEITFASCLNDCQENLDNNFCSTDPAYQRALADYQRELQDINQAQQGPILPPVCFKPDDQFAQQCIDQCKDLPAGCRIQAYDGHGGIETNPALDTGACPGPHF
jgi:hypothetical protein